MTGWRADLQITRTITQGKPVYVLYDPVSFRSHRLTLSDYQVFSKLTPQQTLGDIFDRCVVDGLLDQDEESIFYQFVSRLGQLGILTTQSQTPKQLYQRHQEGEALLRQSRWMSFLFATIPLSNPDRFLDRTIGRVRFLFTPIAFSVWLIGMLVALAMLIPRASEFWEPINGLLALKNAPFMLIAFIGLKVWHELGHGYACKLFGGRVPEMGCKLIVGMPLAYVDASAAWSFPRMRDRIMVMLGGMYFETIIAIPAAIVWAVTPNSPTGAFAYQLVLMAGVATFLFNLNPLMKYDGYFVLSDVVGIPNLRSRSTHELKRFAKRRFLGIDGGPSMATNHRDKTILMIYGVAATIYGQLLLLTIMLMIASQFGLIGMALAAFQIGSMIWKQAKTLKTYLWTANETEPIRDHAKRCGWGLAIATGVLSVLFPVPLKHRVSGVLSASQTTELRVATPGRVEMIVAPVPIEVRAGDPIARLVNGDIIAEADDATWQEHASHRAVQQVIATDQAEAARRLQTAITRTAFRGQAEKSRNELQIVAPHDGRLSRLIPQQSVGMFLKTGDPIATITQGRATVRAWINEEQLLTAKLDIGRRVSVRLQGNQATSFAGTIEAIAPANVNSFEDLSLTTIGEGEIAINPETGRSLEQIFRLSIELDAQHAHDVMHDARVTVRLSRKYESIGSWVFRHTWQFTKQIYAS